MDPYRTTPGSKSPRVTTPASAIVLLVLGAWVVLGTGAPIGKDFTLWAFTGALVVVITLIWQRARGETDRDGGSPPQPPAQG